MSFFESYNYNLVTNILSLNSFFIYLILIPVLGLVLLLVNFFLQETNSYPEKLGAFECGLTTFNQTRSAVSIAFILICILFLPFDLEISSALPFSVGLYFIGFYGIAVLTIFFSILIIGFSYEIYKGGIKIVNTSKASLYKNLVI